MYQLEPLDGEQALDDIAFNHEVTLLPYAEEGARGIYSPAVVDLVGALRDSGIDAACFHDRDHRTIRARLFGPPTAEIIIGLTTGVVSAAAWAGLVAAVRAFVSRSSEKHQHFTARLAVQRQKADGGSETIWFEYQGPMNHLPDALAKLALDQGEADVG
ncbi:hypothetical protein [Nonomuraea typhae]|uniref:hypothetical protein n=1 Tax=Nonomuraea typhae TaxID=2603600 RepID=UPI0012FA3A0B|nr:hypothetical protein [Nonomuraea typhae]